jgi:hypothetical protein
LADGLVRLTEEGLIFASRGSDSRGYFGLTGEGGGLWEKERAPDWDAYCSLSEGLADNGAIEVALVAYAESTGYAFLRAARDSGLYPSLPLDRVVWTLSLESPIYWKAAPRPLSAAFRIQQRGQQVNTALLHASRSWWSDINDLSARLLRTEPGDSRV